LLIDWQLACIGHPLSDVAWFSTLWPLEYLKRAPEFVEFYRQELNRNLGLATPIDSETCWKWYQLGILTTGLPIYTLPMAHGMDVMIEFGVEHERHATIVKLFDLPAFLESILQGPK